MFGAIARGMMVDWEVRLKFAFGGGLGFDPEFALVSGPIELTATHVVRVPSLTGGLLFHCSLFHLLGC